MIAMFWPPAKSFVVLPDYVSNPIIFTTKKEIMHFFKKNQLLATLSVALMFLFTMPVQASAGDFTDDELRNFANAYVQLMSISQQGQQQMIQEIENHDMTVMRFNEITMQAQEMPVEEIEMTEEEAEAFAKLSQVIEEIQMEQEDIFEEAIEAEGLSPERFDVIMREFQQDPELQQRVQELMR